MDHISATIGAHERTAYTVEHRGNCVLITGAVPASAFAVLAQLVPADSIMSADCARLWGATFAMGPADEIDALKSQRAVSAEREARSQYPQLSQAAARWLASGERGVSSNAIFSHLTGVDASKSSGFDTPYDPSDFRRCQLLLEQVPELAARLDEMRSVSPAWACLVDAWPTIIAALDEEAPGWRDGKTRKRAPKANDLIKTAIWRKKA